MAVNLDNTKFYKSQFVIFITFPTTVQLVLGYDLPELAACAHSHPQLPSKAFKVCCVRIKYSINIVCPASYISVRTLNIFIAVMVSL